MLSIKHRFNSFILLEPRLVIVTSELAGMILKVFILPSQRPKIDLSEYFATSTILSLVVYPLHGMRQYNIPESNATPHKLINVKITVVIFEGVNDWAKHLRIPLDA